MDSALHTHPRFSTRHTLRRGLRALCTTLALTTTLTQAQTAIQACGDATQQTRWLQELNAFRMSGAGCDSQAKAQDVAPLQWDDELAQKDELTHIDTQGRSFRDRLRAHAVVPKVAAENLALGTDSLKDTLVAWKESPAHCASLFDGRFTRSALVCVKAHDAGATPYWVAIFMRPHDA